jgi:trigger factor
MNITQEKIDELNSVLKVEVSAEDYETKVEKSLKDHQKKMNLPGFRPGKVPFTVVKKMYGKAVLVDEINKIVIDSMYEYLGQNNIDILGNPLPNKEKMNNVDFDNQKNFEFFYDLGLSPQFEMEALEKLEAKYHNIAINDDVVEKYLNDIRRRFGKYTNPEQVADGDLIYCEFTELENGEPKEGGINHKSSIALDLVKNKTSKDKFIGLKKDDSTDLDIVKTFGDNHEVALMLNVPEEKVAGLKNKFRVKIMAISRVDLAPLDKELFEKVYKSDNIETEEQLKERIKKDAEVSFASESDKNFVDNVVHLLIEKTKISLPDAFLKRWLLETNNEKFTAEQVEKEYSIYVDSLKWQLIENKLLKDNNIEVTRDSVKEYIKDYFRKSVPAGADSDMPDDKLDDIAERMLQNKDEAKRLYDKLYDDKVRELFKSKIKMKKEEVIYEEFVKLATSKHDHHHDHEHDHQH